MQLTTPVPIPKGDPFIDYGSKMVSLGSCFAANIAQKFDYFQLQHTVNPFGILFHPLAIERLVGFAETQKRFTPDDVFFHNERWHHFDAHSDLSHQDRAQLLQHLNDAVANARRALEQSTHIIITYGTAWVYREKQSERIVANCHKVPQRDFFKEILSVAAIVESVRNTIAILKRINPMVQIIFTISPVRHIKDGFAENQRSKSHLIAALHETLETNLSEPNPAYFPSYEIMMDELRDYRFYADDMLHPSPMAIDYIWQRFVTSWFDDSANPVMEQVANIRRSLAHRPFNPDSESYRQFLSKLQDTIGSLQTQFPHMRF